MDIIEHIENMEKIISDKNKLNIEKHERKNKELLEGINKMHAQMSEFLTPLAADYWRDNRIKEYCLRL